MNRLRHRIHHFHAAAAALCACACIAPAPARADAIILKDGRTISGKTFVRQDSNLVVTVGPDGAALEPGIVVPVATIARLNCDPPEVLTTAPKALAAGQFAKVLPEVDAALKATENLGDLPGSPWLDLMVLRAHILVAMGDDTRAAEMAPLLKRTKNPELTRCAFTLLAVIAARQGEFDKAAIHVQDALLDDTSGPASTAAAAVARGLIFLHKEQYPQAMKSFLELPVFLPDETALAGMVLLGTARAYFGMADYNRAIDTLEQLVKTRPGTPEAATATSLLPEWKRRRQVVEDAKKED